MNEYEKLANIFGLVSDPVRLRIVHALLENGPLCAGDLAHRIEVSAANLSNHLRLMRMSQLVSSHREGKQIVYSLRDIEGIQALLVYAKQLVM